MLERTMEDLIANFPSEFFGRHRLTLLGRQGTFQNVGRYDLLFKDEFGTQIIMELKAVGARYEDATQLARYRDALIEKGTKNVLMWLVAPSIPRSVRDFLEHVGIEYTEIHESEFLRVADRHTCLQDQNRSDPHVTAASGKEFPKRHGADKTHGSTDWFLNTDEGEAPGVGAFSRMIDGSCVALWGRPDRLDPEDRLSVPLAGERVFLYLNKIGIIAAGFFTNEPPKAGNTIFGKANEREFHRVIADVIVVDSSRAVSASEAFEMTSYRLPTLRAFCRLDPTAAQRIYEELMARQPK